VPRFADCTQALEALARGLDPQSCHDFRAVREVALCSAWQRFRSSPGDLPAFSQAVRDAWSSIRTACAAHGGTRPEFGFLEPEGAAPRVTGVYQVRLHGQPIGVLVQEADGTLTSCVGGDCRVLAGGAEPGSLPAALSQVSGGALEAVPL
jgi:hypothetical protein